MLLFFLFPHATAPVAVALKQTVDVDNEEVVEELDTKKSFGSLDLKNHNMSKTNTRKIVFTAHV